MYISILTSVNWNWKDNVQKAVHLYPNFRGFVIHKEVHSYPSIGGLAMQSMILP